MILDLAPTTVELIIAKAQRAGVTVDELLYEFACDEELYFDIERMKVAIGETDENGRVKNTHQVPDWAMTDLASFDKWLASV